MYIKNYLFAAGIILASCPAITQAQGLSTFDDLNLPGTDTNFASTQPQGAYAFQSGPVLFYGELTSWGGYSGFNYSNMRDDTTQNFSNDKSAITGMGFDSSANYGICFVPLDFQGADPTATIPVGAKIVDDSVGGGRIVEGAYFTNITYAYWYMKNYFQPGNWFKMTVRGYLNGQKVNDSVDFMLGEVANDSTQNIVNAWTWVDLSVLGHVDSLAFDLSSNDTVGGFGMNNPAYFAIDNLMLQVPDDTSGTGIAGINGSLFSPGIWPNPVLTTLHIVSKSPVDIAVYDLSGKCVLRQKQTTTVNVTSLAAGAYFIRVADEAHGLAGIQKFVKQ
ncbi:MAG TPA: DUF4465 domain-containing protein [Edaphocola sp.]|nr:DUF4465 domain-containing protein [Edaphocola sp.]